MTSADHTYAGRITLVDDELSFTWDKEAAPSDEAGVYQILAPSPVRRLRGSSPVLYIGRSGNLAFRLAQLEAWGHNVTLRLYEVMHGADLWGDLPLDQRACRVEVRVTDGAGSDPELEEVRRIAAFESAHCELPPLNRSSPGYLLFLVQRRLMEGLSARLEALRGFGASMLEVRGVWDQEDEGITYVDLAVDRVIRIRLAWTWPAAWQTSVRRPGWWPTDDMPYKADALFLFVHKVWPARRHGSVKGSIYWRKAEEGEPWFGLNQPILLPASLLQRPSDPLVALFAKGQLGALGKPLKPDASMTEALRQIWADLGERIGEAVREGKKLDKLAAQAVGEEGG